MPDEPPPSAFGQQGEDGLAIHTSNIISHKRKRADISRDVFYVDNDEQSHEEAEIYDVLHLDEGQVREWIFAENGS